MTFLRSLSVLAGALALGGAALIAVPAIARTTPPGNDAAGAAQARVSLGEAVRVAERHARGKAAHAEYETTARGGVYAVEVVRGAETFDVTVDATKGTVLSSVADRADRDDEAREGDEARERGAKE